MTQEILTHIRFLTNFWSQMIVKIRECCSDQVTLKVNDLLLILDFRRNWTSSSDPTEEVQK